MTDQPSNEVLAEQIKNTRAIAIDAQRRLENMQKEYVPQNVFDSLHEEVGRIRYMVQENTRTRLLMVGGLLALQPVVAYLVQAVMI